MAVNANFCQLDCYKIQIGLQHSYNSETNYTKNVRIAYILNLNGSVILPPVLNFVKPRGLSLQDYQLLGGGLCVGRYIMSRP